MAVAFPIVLQISGAEFPRWARFIAFQSWITVVLFLFASLLLEILRKRRNDQHPFTVRNIMLVSLVGAVIGAIVAPLVWAIVPADTVTKLKDESDPLGTSREDHQGASDLSNKGDAGKKLPLKLHAFFFAAGNSGEDLGHIQLASVTVTNTSDRNMSLSANMSLDHREEDGSPGRMLLLGEWNSPDIKPNSGEKVLNIPAQSTVETRLDFYVHGPKSLHDPDWGSKFSDNGRLQLHDLISGVRDFGDANRYPGEDKSPAPLNKLCELWKANRGTSPSVESYGLHWQQLPVAVLKEFPTERSDKDALYEDATQVLFRDFTLKLERSSQATLAVVVKMIDGEKKTRHEFAIDDYQPSSIVIKAEWRRYIIGLTAIRDNNRKGKAYKAVDIDVVEGINN